MKNMLRFVVSVLAGFQMLDAQAFNPPLDSKNNLSLEIRGVEQEVSTATPLKFEVILSNNSATNVNGTLKVWLNDDWRIQECGELAVQVSPGTSETMSFSAQAGARVLSALYPVHALFKTDCGATELHPIAIFDAKADTHPQVPRTALQLHPGVQRLSSHEISRMVAITHNNVDRELGINFQGSDSESSASFNLVNHAGKGITRSSINVHPPYRNGTGAVWSDYQIVLPPAVKTRLDFHTALRESEPDKAGSDGVEFKVFVIDESQVPSELFYRFSAAKTWEHAEVDLSEYAGKTITLRLWCGPGPHNNTAYDAAFWGDPALICGNHNAAVPTAEYWQKQSEKAVAAARQALKGENRTAHGRFQLDVRGEKFGAAVVPGSQGLTDALFAFTDGNETLIYHGFQIDVNSTPAGAVELGAPIVKTEYKAWFGKLHVIHHISTQSGLVKARAMIYADKGALRIDWDMPGVKRDHRGNPRFTRLAIGSCDTTLKRIYAGFGNVIEYPASFTLRAGGFSSSTRHVGADYENGLSLLQASTVFPDRVVYNQDLQRFALETPHDTGFYLIPSAKGAFASARAFRDICGYKRSRGWEKTVGRMNLDQWGGDYVNAANDLKLAAKYGLHHSIFVKHSWQRWGYDYRLPEIYPPRDSFDEFLAMRKAAADAGILFAPHDNYIDFYPDAADYSYDHIVFNQDGTPQKAWLNKGRNAQSYRWLPHAFQPWMEENMRLMRDGFQPDALFIDVFTAKPPIDYYDRDGKFYSRELTAKLWGEAFNTCRNTLKRGYPMMSEAGTDALIGYVDAGQSDHFHACRWMNDYQASCRTPWHDMVSHGKMVLMAGGLGARYSAVDWERVNRPEHGYGSDDYLSNTIIGGRNPMANGPFSREAVVTYWLLHDICNQLARDELESHQFGATIAQQHTTFGHTGKVWSNRGKASWKIPAGYELPQYGFYAEHGTTRAGIVSFDGQRAAFAQSTDAVFVDARPPYDDPRQLKLAAEVLNGSYLGNGQYSFTVRWSVFDPHLPDLKTFLHIDKADKNLDEGDNIAFQRSLNFPIEKLNSGEQFETTTTFTVPDNMEPGEYAIRFGLYNPNRIRIMGNVSGNSRVKGGIIKVAKQDGAFSEGSWSQEEHDPIDPSFIMRNTSGKKINFGAVITDGAFRIVFHKNKSWMLIPLPYSRDCSAELNLNQLKAPSDKVSSITAVEADSTAKQPIQWTQSEDVLSLNLSGKAFGYLIQFE